MRGLSRTLAVLAASAFAAAVAVADELRIPVGSQRNAEAGALPPHGMPMQRVRAGWGEPAAEQAPVGQPPITRWDYPGFSVYFEYDHVVHAVVRHRRADGADPAAAGDR